MATAQTTAPAPVRAAAQHPPASYDRVLVWLLAASVAGAVLQITLGGVVRVTGSGLGCPDWPLCHGSIVPIFRDYHTALEWSHRLTGSLLGIILIAAAARTWFRRSPGAGIAGFSLNGSREPALAWLTTVTLVLVAIAGGIGGSVVLTELDPGLRTLHLALAEGVALSAAAAWTVATHSAARNGTLAAGAAGPGQGAPRKTFRLSALAAAAVLAALLSGSYAVWRSAGEVCPSWPLCGGPVLPDNEFTMVHMTHRLLAGIGAALALWAAHRAFRLKDGPPALKLVALGGLALVTAQVLVGAANPWTRFDEWARALHLTLATLLWVDMALVALMGLRPVPKAGSAGSSAIAAGAQN